MNDQHRHVPQPLALNKPGEGLHTGRHAPAASLAAQTVTPQGELTQHVRDVPTPTCRACAHSYMEPDDDLTCGHPDSGPMGLYVGNGHGPDSEGGHCGAARTKFQQHPLRTPDGNLKSSVKSADAR